MTNYYLTAPQVFERLEKRMDEIAQILLSDISEKEYEKQARLYVQGLEMKEQLKQKTK